MGESSVETARLSAWAEEAPARVDLALPEQDAWVRRVADELSTLVPHADDLRTLEVRHRGMPVLVRLAIKLAASKRFVESWPSGTRLSVVYAVYKEHNRLRSRAEHPHGESSLVRKVEQIEWLLAGVPHVRWRILIVDDGCPKHSGRIAQEIVDSCGLGDRVEVRFLRDAISVGHPAVRGLASTDESQKGGSIEYAMAVEADDEPAHVVTFTDADLSTHLGQIGLLADPVLTKGYVAAIGSRREPLSVVIKSGTRDARGRLFIYLWKRLIPTLNPIIDTQCGFKAFRADTVRALVEDTIEKRFAFDIELLLRAELAHSGSTARVPIAWIDSEAESTTKELQPYLPMLQGIVRIAGRYLPPSQEARGFAELIESLDEESWARLASRVPPEIAEREPAELGEYAGTTPDDLRRIAKGGR